MVKLFAQFGMDGHLPPAPVTVDSPIEDRRAFATATEEAMGAVFDILVQGMPTVEGVTTRTTTITGEDGNDITLFISRPSDADAALPCVVHLHGGGMAIGSATDAAYMRLREYLAATGLVVVGVEFRNSSGKLGPHPYPAGLNDCASATRWVAANRWLEAADELPSLRECDGYFIGRDGLAVMGSIYDPTGAHSRDATCFAGVAADEELAGLPPHVISVNELDPLRDEGLQYYRRLVHAGVPTVGRVVAGTCHGGDMLMAGVMPEVFEASMRDVSGFAKSVG
jgi:acetyl esterase